MSKNGFIPATLCADPLLPHTLLRYWKGEKIYVNVLEYIFKENTVTIKLHMVSKKIPIKKRVKQSDAISLIVHGSIRGSF